MFAARSDEAASVKMAARPTALQVYDDPADPVHIVVDRRDPALALRRDVSAFAPQHPSDLAVGSIDLDRDGETEVVAVADHTYNSVGRRVVDVVVIDGDEVVHGRTLYPEPYDLASVTGDPGHPMGNDPQALFVGGTVPCAMLLLSLHTEGNGCNGCTAGGPTRATFETVALRDGKARRVDAGTLWTSPP